MRKEVLDGDYESLPTQLKPTEGSFDLAFAMFRDMWNAKLAGAKAEGAALEKSLRETERKIERLIDRLVDVERASVVAAYEKRIADLETEKALLAEKAASCGKPLAS